MLYRNLFESVVHKGFSFFMGSCSVCILQYGNSWINRTANVRNVAAPCAWSAKHYHKKTHYCNDDSITRWTKYYCHSTTVLVYYIFDDYWTCSVLVKIYKNILGGLIP